MAEGEESEYEDPTVWSPARMPSTCIPSTPSRKKTEWFFISPGGSKSVSRARKQQQQQPEQQSSSNFSINHSDPGGLCQAGSADCHSVTLVGWTQREVCMVAVSIWLCGVLIGLMITNSSCEETSWWNPLAMWNNMRRVADHPLLGLVSPDTVASTREAMASLAQSGTGVAALVAGAVGGPVAVSSGLQSLFLMQGRQIQNKKNERRANGCGSGLLDIALNNYLDDKTGSDKDPALPRRTEPQRVPRTPPRQFGFGDAVKERCRRSPIIHYIPAPRQRSPARAVSNLSSPPGACVDRSKKWWKGVFQRDQMYPGKDISSYSSNPHSPIVTYSKGGSPIIHICPEELSTRRNHWDFGIGSLMDLPPAGNSRMDDIPLRSMYTLAEECGGS